MKSVALLRGFDTRYGSIGKRVQRLLKGTRAKRTDAPFRRRSEAYADLVVIRRSRFVWDQVEVGFQVNSRRDKC